MIRLRAIGDIFLDVPGEKLLEVESEAKTQDFIMINHPVFFIDDPKDYIALIRRAGSTNPLGRLSAAATAGFRGARTIFKLQRIQIPNPMQTRYFSMVPYQLGTGPDREAIKFSAKPCSTRVDPIPEDPSPNYLREALAASLANSSGCFEFLVQPRTSDNQSVENSRVEWKESESPFYKVAHITIPEQVFDTEEQHTFCENLSFNPWHALPEHRPLGAVNRVRKVVYEHISRVRHQMNNVPRVEP